MAPRRRGAGIDRDRDRFVALRATARSLRTKAVQVLSWSHTFTDLTAESAQTRLGPPSAGAALLPPGPAAATSVTVPATECRAR